MSLFKAKQEEQYLFEKLGLAIESSKIAIEELQKMINNQNYTDFRKIVDLENDGDIMSYNLSLWVLDGNISSPVLNSVTMLITKTDDILDYTRYLSKEIFRARQRKDKTCFFMTELNEIIALIFSALEELDSIFNAKKLTLETVKNKRGIIENLENRGDEIKEKAFDTIYANERDWFCFNHLEKLIQGLDNILDTCEDISDLILQFLVAVSS
jgi:hypothetical protein